ncbi:LPS export ABC transporter protein LptC [Parabacteroides sp. PF5-5]|uniref:LPS export ABC transporter periplasmic protein LptC n=2 Tax=Parabacteroides TaxID=375288 RepID=UPI00247D27EC|nr:LPS export ABC transporter protein LptC [Parabacteroides sp. PH5-39]MDH6316337.1 LPS export ABC transporter protein LptC [Parabacteroides sp. PF5-13]MDH6319820.1 LPS export ABC transporter protein LptC [Parabacteroides sp. PH5-13]MDH6323589.1 LPS export ABC transporter protein LptC [Parabacteroides sp. PH5-8]MDH6327524.1 LPS export ABC transporter protein LptC [Parabacteroides sp. PH5-41]MDH6335336.1 LPS export ABC transporter protein LptC [Parabacteroides sp. PF5-5]MDH6346399.1 LPS export
MCKERIPYNMKNNNITTIPLIVVMFLLLSASCSKEKQETVEVVFDPENTYTMRTLDVSTLVSDSGMTRYRATAKEWLMFSKAAEPYWYFPEGLYLERFDSLFNAEATVKADTAYYYQKKELWKLINNVEIQNMKGEFFETSLLYWDGKEDKIYSDKFIRIVQKDQVLTGIGFESNQNMTKYIVYESTGVFPINETPKDSIPPEE